MDGITSTTQCRGVQENTCFIDSRERSDLWERHGNNWALIKELDKEMPKPRLWNHTQVDLKDQMQNVKIGLMRRGDPVPDNYCQIHLSDRHLKSIA
ncbi:conserved hypothetical protein [Coccidioides posadasii str. Silveira]|uniref:Uncharacterized protein n=1 Tax=Coccidioides posadasii (strain RMSCC 757 / Silveira) TaxID=443226 RepID=E9DK69_COCPS|nr:conserved hypothetical protein [Coccidioides posadasii str. Silveira]